MTIVNKLAKVVKNVKKEASSRKSWPVWQIFQTIPSLTLSGVIMITRQRQLSKKLRAHSVSVQKV